MATRNEEQLLNELLRDMRESDERLAAADLEPRVVEAFLTIRSTVRHAKVRLKADTTYYMGFAAAAVIAVFLFTLRSTGVDRLPVVRPPELRVVAINAPVEFPLKPSPTKSRALPIAQSPITQSPITQSSITQSPIAQSPIAQSQIEFQPLVPLGEHELAGSFQIVRVQMPRASLGALTSPFEHPSEFVEADVLLGEDGMARAIRVSTNGSGYPWRSK